jgi:alkylation response protein AidB-like acyl-CoA dehydrogenase
MGGFVAPHFPEPWGTNAGVVAQLVIYDEMRIAGLEPTHDTFVASWIGPSLLLAGSPYQRERYIWPMLTGEETWARLHTEPDAGCDLARVATRAVRAGDGYVITGQKIWAANAATADFGALLARTDGTPSDPAGLSYFILPLATPGITVRPIRDLMGRTFLNEVFLDNVVIPAVNRIGDEGDGLRLRRPDYQPAQILFNPGWAPGPTTSIYHLIPLFEHADVPGQLRDGLLDRYLEARSLDALTLLEAQEEVAFGRSSDGRFDVRRLVHQEHGRELLELVHDLAETLATGLPDAATTILHRPDLTGSILQVPIRTISGGTSEMHRESIAARLFGDHAGVLRSWAGVSSQPETHVTWPLSV